MKYYRNPETHEVFAYEGDPLITGLVSMTDDEVSAHLNPPKSREDVEVSRLVAYADPVTGSDRFQIEAGAERLCGNEDKAKLAEQKWLARRAEIAAQLPWPESK